ncbi:MAG: hypothetical protein RBG13Loki_3600 [Promethearchaeota archaeon CR_4]|nr:MAG: hypothetical protein RBG13Loki_3600 [Candidatus Lokiarchaeota archaeon CR_4]
MPRILLRIIRIGRVDQLRKTSYDKLPEHRERTVILPIADYRSKIGRTRKEPPVFAALRENSPLNISVRRFHALLAAGGTSNFPTMTRVANERFIFPSNERRGE